MKFTLISVLCWFSTLLKLLLTWSQIKERKWIIYCLAWASLLFGLFMTKDETPKIVKTFHPKNFLVLFGFVLQTFILIISCGAPAKSHCGLIINFHFRAILFLELLRNETEISRVMMNVAELWQIFSTKSISQFHFRLPLSAIFWAWNLIFVIFLRNIIIFLKKVWWTLTMINFHLSLMKRRKGGNLFGTWFW